MIISFIIPVYNTGTFLERCVNSILNQGIDTSMFEVIIINDGSTDNSITVIEKLVESHNNIKSIVCLENKGPGAARNAGISISHGKYIFFVDSDDYILENSLSPLFKYAQSHNLDIIGFDWQQLSSNGVVLKKSRENRIYNTPMSGSEYLAQFNFTGGVWSYLFSTSLLKNTPIKMPEGIYHEDELFLSEAFTYARQIVFVNQLVYTYCDRKGSIMNNKNADFISKRISDTLYVLDELSLLLKRSDLSKVQKDGVVNKVNTLTVDFILNLIRFDIDTTLIKKNLQELRTRNLYPLTKKFYSWKHLLFSLVFSCKTNVIVASRCKLFKKK